MLSQLQNTVYMLEMESLLRKTKHTYSVELWYGHSDESGGGGNGVGDGGGGNGLGDGGGGDEGGEVILEVLRLMIFCWKK